MIVIVDYGMDTLAYVLALEEISKANASHGTIWRLL
jgi:hypothetical protein